MSSPPRRARVGGARRRPVRYREGDGSTALREGLRAHRAGDLRAATDRYLEALARDPAELDARMNLSAVYVLRGLCRAAEASWAEALPLAADDPRALRDVGFGLATIGAFDAAAGALSRALALDPDAHGARLALCRVEDWRARASHALGLAEEAVARRPDDASAWLELHRARFDDRDPAPCREAAMRAVACDPAHVDARLLLAGALALEGRAAEAHEALACVVPEGLCDAMGCAVAWRREGTRAFASKRAALEHALAAAGGEGVVAEFGVRFGVSTRLLAAHAGEVHGFDSFAGLPEPWGSVPAGAFTMEGVAPALPANVSLHVGLFEDTAPSFAATLAAPLRLVHVDSDLYASARVALDALAPRVGVGCVLVFDEYFGNARWREDEHRAFEEVRAAAGWHVEPLSLSWATGQAAFRVVG